MILKKDNTDFLVHDVEDVPRNICRSLGKSPEPVIPNPGGSSYPFPLRFILREGARIRGLQLPRRAGGWNRTKQS